MAIKSYIDKDGKKKYKFNVYLGIDPLTGKKKYTNRKGFTSEKQAKIEISKLQLGLQEINKKQPTFKIVYRDWFEIYKDTVKASTLARTEDAFRVHIIPTFGEFLIDKVTIKHCQDWVNKKAKEIVKYKEYSNYLKKVFSFAISRGYRQHNPCDHLIYPKMIAKRSKDINIIWTKDELKAFLDLVKKEKTLKWYAFFRLLAYTGIRRGEILALEWSDLDFKNKVLTISKSRKRTAKGEVTGDTKTGSVRDVAIDAETLKILLEWRKKQLQIQGIQKIIFTNSKKTYILLNHPLKVLNSIIEKHNLRPIDIHRFRHIHTTMMILSNKSENSLGAIMERLGHTDIKTTMNIYNHIMDEEKEEILNNYLEYLK
ncbi:MAG: site-specific integrase [Tissierellia bacterium]|nr:site-specific integrase [Tissierellia bacterium]